jgi:acyl-CoA reductase-like NAD-dependent aldehyde dehydrogenase
METRLLIAGEQVAGEGPGLDVENPYTQATLATVALPSAEQVDAAIAAARAAARGWADTPAVERCELLHEVATRLRAEADTLADLMTREGGKRLEPGTDLGPMVSAPQRDKVGARVDAAVAAGAQLVTGGDAGGQGTGHFYAPTVVTGAPAQTDLLREETFGPVAPIVPVASLDEAIALANSTRFGLGANVYTRDLETVVRCMREIKAGTVWFNDPLTDNDAGPFGGYKQSGLGRELGQEGLEAFQETKHVHIETRIAAKSWWYPYGATA